MGMLRIKSTFISDVQPPVSDCLWLKLEDDGVSLFLVEAGTPKPLKLSNSNSNDTVEKSIEEIKKSLIGAVLDNKTADTINGAKAYTEDRIEAIKGTSKDNYKTLTLYGLKAYIDNKVSKKSSKDNE